MGEMGKEQSSKYEIKMINIRYILKHSRHSIALADQVVFSGAGFISTLISARLLSVNDFGIYAAITLFLYLTVSVSNSLIIQPFQVSYPIEDTKASYVGFVFWKQLALLGVIIIALSILDHFHFTVLEPFSVYRWPVVLLVVSFLLHDFFRKLLLAIDQIGFALAIDSTTAVIQLCTLGIYMIKGQGDLYQIFTATALSYLAGAIVGIFVVKPRLLDLRNWKRFCLNHLAQGKWLFLTALIQWWSSNLFVVASGVFLGPIALGAFRLVQSMFGVLNILLQSYENYALPHAVRLSRTSMDESKNYLKGIGIKGALIFGSVLFILFIFSSSVIQFAGGDKYTPYAYVIRGMAVLYFIIFAGYPVRMSIRMLVMNNVFFAGYLASFIFSLLTFHYLLNAWHLWGAIAGLIINQLILITIWQYYLIKKQFVLWR